MKPPKKATEAKARLSTELELRIKNVSCLDHDEISAINLELEKQGCEAMSLVMKDQDGNVIMDGLSPKVFV